MSNQASASGAGARTDIDDVVGAANRFLIVFYHQQRVALGGELLKCGKQNLVVARMQTDCRLVQDVTDTLEVSAELGG